MSGRKARERRKQELPHVEVPEVPHVEVPRPRFDHPLGTYAGVYVDWQERMKQQMLAEIERTQRALARCTYAYDCPSSVHHPGCWATK